MANRDQPVNGKRSTLSILKTGNLVLTDAAQSIVWSTDTQPSSIHNPFIFTIQLPSPPSKQLPRPTLSHTFTAGFYPIGENAYSFAIWFTQKHKHLNNNKTTIVWMANRDQPVNGKRSMLSILKTGNLVLTDAAQSIVWSTDTQPSSIHNPLIFTIQLPSPPSKQLPRPTLSHTFTAGFYPIGENAYSFAIWFTQKHKHLNNNKTTIVWMANRDQPVNGKRSTLSILKTGNLVLTDAAQSIVWSTDTQPSSIHNPFIFTIQLPSPPSKQLPRPTLSVSLPPSNYHP
ncbi:hypothetical protein RYX36_017962 [Vicia faba]